MQFPITIGLRRSRIWLIAFLTLAGLLSLLIGLGLRENGILAGIGNFLALLLIAIWQSRRPAVSALQISQSGKLAVAIGKSPEFREARHAMPPFVHSWLTVLYLQEIESSDAPTHALVIFPDMINQEDFRRLRVCLKWQKPEKKASADGA